MKEKINVVNWKKASIALGLSLGLLGPVSLYGPEVLTAKAANSTESVSQTPEENTDNALDQAGQVKQEAETNTSEEAASAPVGDEGNQNELEEAQAIAKDWVNSVEYVARDEAGNPQAYSYTRNYQTHRINAGDLDSEAREDWAVNYIIDYKSQAEKYQYDQAANQLAESGIDASQIVGQDDDNYYVQVGNERQALAKAEVTEANATAIQQVLDQREKEALRSAYSQAPDFAQNEYLEGKIIYDGELKYRSLHAYEDTPELNHYHHRPVSRYNETEQAALDHILARNSKQLEEKYNQALEVAPNWAEEVPRIETDENGQVINYIVDHGDHTHEMAAADLSPEQRDALDFIVKTNRDRRQQEVYQTTPEWTRHVEAKIVDRDGNIHYKTLDLDGNVAYENADGLSQAQLEGIDFLLELEAERQAGVQRRSRERAKDYLPGLVRGIKDDQGDYVSFVYEDGRQVPASEIPRTPSRALTRILNYQEEQDALKLEQAEALAPIWASDLIAKVEDDQGKVTYVQDHGDHYHHYEAADLSDQAREAVEYIVSAKNIPVENSLDQWPVHQHNHDHENEQAQAGLTTSNNDIVPGADTNDTSNAGPRTDEVDNITPLPGGQTTESETSAPATSDPSAGQTEDLAGQVLASDTQAVTDSAKVDNLDATSVDKNSVSNEERDKNQESKTLTTDSKASLQENGKARSNQADPAGDLPKTGSNALILAGLGLGLISAGGSLLKRKED